MKTINGLPENNKNKNTTGRFGGVRENGTDRAGGNGAARENESGRGAEYVNAQGKYDRTRGEIRKGDRNPGLAQNNYAAIDLGTNSCRLVVATPTTTSFRVVETFSKVVRLGEGIIQDNELSPKAMRRTIQALKICRGVIDEYMPIAASRFVATAACRRAKNVAQFAEMAKREAGIELEVISSKEEARLSVVGCLPLLNRNIKSVLVFDIGGGIRGGRRGMNFFHALSLFLRLRGVFLFFEDVHASSPHAYRPNSPMPEVWSLPNSVAEPEPRSSPRPSARAPITTLVSPPA